MWVLAVSLSSANPRGSLAEPRQEPVREPASSHYSGGIVMNTSRELRLHAPGSNGSNKYELALSGVLALQLILCDHEVLVVPELQILVIKSCCEDHSVCL